MLKEMTIKLANREEPIMAHEKIVTLFDSAIQAEAAKRNLVKAGFSDRDISLISGER